MYSLLLHNIRSLQNIGSLFRSTDGAGWDRVYLTGYTGMPPRREITKTALGAEESVSWEYYEDPIPLLETLKSQGTLIIALEGTDASEDIFHFLDHENIDSRDVCLILGSEREGVDPRMLALSDYILHIPMRGMKQSLNVSIAGALGMYLLFAKKKNIV